MTRVCTNCQTVSAAPGDNCPTCGDPYGAPRPPEAARAPGAVGQRPGEVTAAAVLLFVLAGLNLLFALAGAGGVSGLPGGSFLTGLIFFSLAVAAAQIFAGVTILQGKDTGRIVGITVSAISGVLAVIAILGGLMQQVLGLGLNAFILFALIKNARYFAR